MKRYRFLFFMPKIVKLLPMKLAKKITKKTKLFEGKTRVKTVVTCTVTMSQLGEAVVSDGPAKSWAIGSAGSAPSSSRVRDPSDNYFTYFFFFFFSFDFVCSVFPSSLGFKTLLCTKCLLLFFYTIYLYLHYER